MFCQLVASVLIDFDFEVWREVMPVHLEPHAVQLHRNFANQEGVLRRVKAGESLLETVDIERPELARI